MNLFDLDEQKSLIILSIKTNKKTKKGIAVDNEIACQTQQRNSEAT